MSSASQLASAPAGGGGDAAMGSLRRINGLSYQMAPSLSVVTTRTTREWPASQASYDTALGSQTLTGVISTGAAYVDGRNSYLKFDLKVTVPAASVATTWGWGQYGSALNLFDTIRLTHSSGYLIERHQDTFHQWKYDQSSWGKTQEWRDTVLPMMQGVQKVAATGALRFPGPSKLLEADAGENDRTGIQKWFTILSADVISVAIPISELSDIFDTDSLLPSFLMAGLRIELSCVNSLDDCMQGFDATSVGAGNNGARSLGRGAGSFAIDNIRFALETVTLTDGITRSLATMAANSGMQIPFNRIHSTVSVYGAAAADSDTIQINRALSRANMVGIARVQNTTGLWAAAGAAPAQESDYCHLIPKPSRPQAFQVKLGAEFFPNQPLVGVVPTFQTSQVAWGAFRGSMPNGVSPKDYYYQAGLVSQTLEKSSTLSQSGVPIAANRDLNIDFEYVDLTAAGTPGDEGLKNTKVYTYVPHVAVASIFLDSVIVRS